MSRFSMSILRDLSARLRAFMEVYRANYEAKRDYYTKRYMDHYHARARSHCKDQDDPTTPPKPKPPRPPRPREDEQ